jgi:hypothetical protein
VGYILQRRLRLPHELIRGRDPVSRSKEEKSRRAPFEQLKSLLLRSKVGALDGMTEDRILSILALRRARTEVLGAGLFSDPAWDTLLELYAANLGRRCMSVANLAVAIGEPQSTTARWVVALEERGLVTTEDLGLSLDLSVELSAKARICLERLMDRWTCAFLST